MARTRDNKGIRILACVREESDTMQKTTIKKRMKMLCISEKRIKKYPPSAH